MVLAVRILACCIVAYIMMREIRAGRPTANLLGVFLLGSFVGALS